MPRPPRPANDQGETLIELIIAIAIMGIALVAVVSGIGTSILISGVHRKESTAGALARDDAESLVAAGYTFPCTYSVPPTPQAGFTATVSSISSWNGSKFASGCSNSGLHKVTVQVSSTDIRATESIDVVIRDTS